MLQSVRRRLDEINKRAIAAFDDHGSFERQNLLLLANAVSLVQLRTQHLSPS